MQTKDKENLAYSRHVYPCATQADLARTQHPQVRPKGLPSGPLVIEYALQFTNH